MALQVLVVFVLLLTVVQNARRGERCVNRRGETATCTNIYSCKAAIDALAKANVNKIYATGQTCGYDTEALICCKTLADSTNQPETGDVDIFTNLSALMKFVNTPIAFVTSSRSMDNFSMSSNFTLPLETAKTTTLPNTTASSRNSDLPLFTSPPLTTEGSATPLILSVQSSSGDRNGSPPGATTMPSLNIFTSPPLIIESNDLPAIGPLSSNKTGGVAATSSHLFTSPPLTGVESNTVPNVAPLLFNSTDASSVDNVTPSVEAPRGPEQTATTERASVAAFTEPSRITATNQFSINKLLPDRYSCGYQNDSERLADASITTVDEFPWIALLRYSDAYGYEAGFRCVGSLINDRYVITAASCVITEPVLCLVGVRLGEWMISSSKDCGYDGECTDKVIDLRIKTKVPHPYYRPGHENNNVALLQLEENVKYTVFVRPICLPVYNLSVPDAGTVLTTSGWGTSKYGYRLDIKSKIHIPVLYNDECLNSWGNVQRLLFEQVCIGKTTRSHTCVTDSGGSVMGVHGKRPQWYLEGIIPGSFYCGQQGFPGVYTRITKYINWILETIAKNSLNTD